MLLIFHVTVRGHFNRLQRDRNKYCFKLEFLAVCQVNDISSTLNSLSQGMGAVADPEFPVGEHGYVS